MLPKSKRVERRLFKPLLESKRAAHSPHFSLRSASSESARASVSVSKKVSKSAVVRNKVRRRVYSALRDMEMPRRMLLFIAKPGAEKVKGEALTNELEKLIRSITD